MSTITVRFTRNEGGMFRIDVPVVEHPFDGRHPILA